MERRRKRWAFRTVKRFAKQRSRSFLRRRSQTARIPRRVGLKCAGWQRIGPSVLWTQTLVNEAQIACALERYRLAHGEYPAALDTLVPQFIQKLPRDIINGEPLIYRRTDDGSFILYSVGWNETDDGGQIALPKGDVKQLTIGDWVWKNSISEF